jgi:hypothetical protein
VVRARLAIGASLAVALFAATPTTAAPGPALKLLKASPVAVRGTGFEPRETVRITVRAGNGVTRATAAADRAGTFAATIRGAVASRCATLLISASGSGGSRAVFRRYPQCAIRGG